MSAAPPKGWTRVLVRPYFRGDHRHALFDMGAEFNPALDAWVVEPLPARRFNAETGQWGPEREWLAHWKVERTLGQLGQVELEWQVGGPSCLPRRSEDIEPVTRTNRGFSTPNFQPSGKVRR